MRIRTIKPEFWRNRKLASLGREVHDLAARLITACDDEGFCEADPALIAGDLYPFDSDAQKFIKRALPELERIGFILIKGGEHGIICLPTFREHQRINRPSVSRLRPRFEAFAGSFLQAPESAQFSESSVSTHGALSEPSPTEEERERELGKGTGKGKGNVVALTPPAPTPSDLMRVWNEHTRPPVAQCRELSPKREAAARLRLTERPLAEWVEVVRRINASSFCCGQNDRGWVATFDWLLQPDVAVKVLEGKYDNRPTASASKTYAAPAMPTQRPEGKVIL